jgi:NodT family efflux transporter outer membrane factor (OMF) lipoprotein
MTATDAASFSPPWTRRRLAYFPGAAVLFLAGCASLPPPETARQAKAPAAYATAESFKAPQAAWPGDAWWRDYGDPQLTALIEEGLKDSPTLAEAEARLRKAQALTATARAAGAPQISVNGSATKEKQSYNNGIPEDFVPRGYNSYGRLTLDFAWELDFWGKNRAAVAAARSEAEAARADAAEARLALSTNIAAAYADLARLFAQRDVAERALGLRGETESLVQKRVVNGLDTQGELRQAQAGPPAARADLAAVDEEIALTRNRLAALMGQGPDRGLSIARPATAALKPLGLPANLAADLVGRRPDVAAARWRAEAAARRVAESKAAFYPNINLAAFVGAQSLHLSQLFDQGSDIGSVGPALSLPIFQGGRLRAGLRGAQADRDAAVAVYDATLTEALRTVADVVASQRALSVRLGESRQALAADEDAFRIARLRYDGALSNYQSVLLAEQAVLAQRRVVADLESRAFALDVALVRALGGGFASS